MVNDLPVPATKAGARNLNFFYGDFRALKDITMPVHERKVTASINRLYEVAAAEKDYASHAFLEWFLTEQIEEEKTSTQLADTLRMAGDHPGALLMLDREAGARSGAGAEESAE